MRRRQSSRLRRIERQTDPVNGCVRPADPRADPFVVFVGHSGRSKSTLLRLIARLEQVSSGHINTNGQDCTHAPPSQRHVTMVFPS